MSERRGLWSPLSDPWVYEAFHHLIGARRWLKQFAKNIIHAQRGDCLFDIGCGPGPLLRYLPLGTTYVGFDRNKTYIERANSLYSNRGKFICDDVCNFARYSQTQADIVVAIGILHHLDNDLASSMLRVAANALKPGGRLITADPCFHPKQSALQRLVVRNDRGTHVRHFEQYVELIDAVLSKTKASYQSGHIPFPHSICIVQATREAT